MTGSAVFAGCIGAAVILLANLPARAADSCDGTTQADLNACVGAEYRAADAALNGVYVQLMKRIGPQAKDALRAAQKAWLPFRDATCTLESMGLAGGSAYAMAYNGCLRGLTQERTKVLRTYLTCSDENLSCVGRIGE